MRSHCKPIIMTAASSIASGRSWASRMLSAGKLRMDDFLGDRAAVGEHGPGVQFELDVIAEPNGFMQLDQRRQRSAAGVQPLAGAGVGGDDHAPAIGPRRAGEHRDQARELRRRVHVLLAVGADDEVFLRLQAQPRQHVAGLDLGQVVVQHLVHGAAGLDDPVRRQPFAQQVLPGDRE